MAFEQKPNSGAMFVNEQKKTENHPDWRGDLHLDKTFIIEQMNKADGPLVKIAVSGWTKTAKSGKDYLSLSASEPWVKKDSDLPY
jgi:uncharacterized protein (DUF736 family)